MSSETFTVPYSAMRPTSLRPRSTSIRCSARSFSLLTSSCVMRASSSAERPRRRVPAIGRSVTVRSVATRIRSSGELPTISVPSSTRWYMYGDGLITRSAR